MTQQTLALRYSLAWQLIGYAMILFVVMQSLSSSPISVGFEVSDKVYHLVGYFGLMGWFAQIYHSHRARLSLAAFFVVLGVGLEILQGLGGERHFEVNDMIANTLGVLLAWLVSRTAFSRCLYWFEKSVLQRDH